MEDDSRDGQTRSTRDIVVRTEQRVFDLDRSLREFIQETRSNYRAMSDKFDQTYGTLAGRVDGHEALINKGRGVRWVFAALVAFVAWVASFIPHPKLF